MEIWAQKARRKVQNFLWVDEGVVRGLIALLLEVGKLAGPGALLDRIFLRSRRHRHISVRELRRKYFCQCVLCLVLFKSRLDIFRLALALDEHLGAAGRVADIGRIEACLLLEDTAVHFAVLLSGWSIVGLELVEQIERQLGLGIVLQDGADVDARRVAGGAVILALLMEVEGPELVLEGVAGLMVGEPFILHHFDNYQ